MKSNYKNGFVIVFTLITLALFVVLICQFISIANINQQQTLLDQTLQTKQEEQKKYENDLSNLQDDYEKYVEDYAKGNLGMKNNDETVYEGK